MWKAGLAGITLMSLTAIGSTLAAADDVSPKRSFRPAVRAGSVLTTAQIVRVKLALRLTPAQEQYWQPVEAVLREIAFQSTKAAAENREVRPAATTIDPVKLQRLVSVAYPLVTSLSEEQKRHALALAHALGLDSVAMAF